MHMLYRLATLIVLYCMIVVISFPYSSAFMCYSVRRRRMKRRKAENVMDVFYARFLSCERTGIIVFCIVRTFASTVLSVQVPLCRTLVLAFHCIMEYKQPPPSLHIDSTTMLSDIQDNKCKHFSYISRASSAYAQSISADKGLHCNSILF